MSAQFDRWVVWSAFMRQGGGGVAMAGVMPYRLRRVARTEVAIGAFMGFPPYEEHCCSDSLWGRDALEEESGFVPADDFEKSFY